MPREPRAAEFEQLVLFAILHLGENAYGMTIRREIEDRTERRTSLGAVYTTLDRLEKKGYVMSWTGSPAPQRGGRSKASLQSPDPGKAALRNSAAILAAMAAGLVHYANEALTKRPCTVETILPSSVVQVLRWTDRSKGMGQGIGRRLAALSPLIGEANKQDPHPSRAQAQLTAK